MSVAFAAVGPASGCETEGTGVRPGCICSVDHTGADCVLVPLLLLVPTFKSHH